MLKINYYRLLLLSALSFNSANVLCSSFNQPDSHQNPPNLSLHNANLRTNSSGVANNMTTSNVNFNSFSNSFLNSQNPHIVTNASNITNNTTSTFRNGSTGIINTQKAPEMWQIVVSRQQIISKIPLNLIRVGQIDKNNIVRNGNSWFRLQNPPSFINISCDNMNISPANVNPNTLNSAISMNNRFPWSIPNAPTLNKAKDTNQILPPSVGNQRQKNNMKKSSTKTHNTGRLRPYKCNLCDRSSFTTQSNLHAHLCIHRGEKPFKCGICQKELSSRVALEGHLNKHKGETPYQCEICKRSFRVKYILNDHIKKRHKKDPYQCGKCGIILISKSGLKYHMSTHNRPTQYDCDHCYRVFSNKKDYENHVDFLEEEDEDRKCYDCGTWFQSVYNRNLHKCKKQVIRKDNRDLHDRNKHPNKNQEKK